MDNRIRHFFELLYLLVQKELKVRYKNSFLGYLWALANPFAFAFVYYVAFKIIMRVKMQNYAVFMLTGMFPWVWFTNSLVQATSSYRNNASLVKKVDIDRSVLPLSNVVHEMVHFCFALPVLAFFIVITGGSLHINWIWQIPLMIIIELLMAYPLALVLAVSNVYVHDVEYLIGIVLNMLFFLTPIVYPITMVPEAYRQYFSWSPVAVLIDSWRSILMHGTLDVRSIVFCLAITLVASLFSFVVYRKHVHKLGELL